MGMHSQKYLYLIIEPTDKSVTDKYKSHYKKCMREKDIFKQVFIQ